MAMKSRKPKPKPDDSIIDTPHTDEFLIQLANMLEKIYDVSDDKTTRLIEQARSLAAELPAHKKRVHKLRRERRKGRGDPEITMEEVFGEVLTEKTIIDLCEALTKAIDRTLASLKVSKS